MSRSRTRPPTEVPGLDAERFLGAGAYGEVWVALDRNTGRRVAIKFYAHRGGLDWSLLSREVEKLVFLSADRYVVQLLDVGWSADPPYYVMEYMENGSLDDWLRSQGPLPRVTAVSMFREVAIGLVHAHGKGVLHCDLKPANVLLDQDGRPRLADFGQSRLSHEQKPALGTLFYMAPEQADLKAVPDARWDVYALGALLYNMLTGSPPHRDPAALDTIESANTLEERLQRYRQSIETAPPLTEHRQVAGVDRALAEIVDRCLAVNPQRRYPNVQAVLDALDAREARRARRPLVVLGMIGPALLMLIMGLAAWSGVETIIRQSERALTERVLESNLFAAQYAAKAAANDLDRRFLAVEQVASDPEARELLRELLANPELADMRERLNDPAVDDEDLRDAFRLHPARQALQRRLEALHDDKTLVDVASWFVNDPRGLQVARAPSNDTIARNYAWRTYFHGQSKDRPEGWRPTNGEHIEQTSLSAVFRSRASGRWIIGVSAPIYAADGEFLGVVALTGDVGDDFGVRLSDQEEEPAQRNNEQFAVLVDRRTGGLILQHPLFDRLMENGQRLPDHFENYRVTAEHLPIGAGVTPAKVNYRDPLAEDASGGDYRRDWLAEMAPVTVRGEESGLMVIVQETKDHAIGPTLDLLKSSLLTIGLIALGVVAAVLTLLWGFVARALAGEPASRSGSNGAMSEITPAESLATVSLTRR
ncbi:MAG: serine/threonine protein kinase [Pirellulales bacterium]